MLAVEGVKRAQERFGKGKVMNGEQTAGAWKPGAGPEEAGCARLRRRDASGVHPLRRPHGANWDGKWNSPGLDERIIKPMVGSSADKTGEKKPTADCQSIR